MTEAALAEAAAALTPGTELTNMLETAGLPGAGNLERGAGLRARGAAAAGAVEDLGGGRRGSR